MKLSDLDGESAGDLPSAPGASGTPVKVLGARDRQALNVTSKCASARARSRRRAGAVRAAGVIEASEISRSLTPKRVLSRRAAGDLPCGCQSDPGAPAALIGSEHSQGSFLARHTFTVGSLEKIRCFALASCPTSPRDLLHLLNGVWPTGESLKEASWDGGRSAVHALRRVLISIIQGSGIALFL